MFLFLQSRNVPFGGRGNGDKTEHEHKRIEQVGSNTAAVEKTDEPKGSGRTLASGHTTNKTVVEKIQKTRAAGLISKHRGRKAANRISESVKKQGLDLLKTKYQGVGPTLAHEKWVEKEKFQLSVESVGKIMIEEGLWKSRKLKKVVTHQLRQRRACFGELVQIDGSLHDWFEGRAEACVLLVFIDDATGKLVQLRSGS